MILSVSISLLKDIYLEFRTEVMIVVILILAVILTRLSRWLLDKFVNTSSEKLSINKLGKFNFSEKMLNFDLDNDIEDANLISKKIIAHV